MLCLRVSILHTTNINITFISCLMYSTHSKNAILSPINHFPFFKQNLTDNLNPQIIKIFVDNSKSKVLVIFVCLSNYVIFYTLKSFISQTKHANMCFSFPITHTLIMNVKMSRWTSKDTSLLKIKRIEG
jgi:hexokinase